LIFIYYYNHFRFVFHENWGIKLQDSVVFPLDGLMLDEQQGIVYDLYACVCHTGSMLYLFIIIND